MPDGSTKYTLDRIRIAHSLLLKVTKDFACEQFYWRPGPQAPPIGWHLWHIARWADRLQAALPVRAGATRQQIWEVEKLAQTWGLDSASLGPLQTGEGMDHKLAAALPSQIGQPNILNYAERTFSILNEGLDHLTPDDLAWVRPNIAAFKITEDKRFVSAPAPETPLAWDLAYHMSHAWRHLGMIEALLGAQGLHGTASA